MSETKWNLSNKAEVTRLFAIGAFGNAAGQWDYPESALRAGSRLFAIRYRGPGSNGVCEYDIPWYHLTEKWWRITGTRGHHIDFYISDCSNPNSLVIQGEVCLTTRGIRLEYTTVQKKMRLALKEERLFAERTAARCILRHHLDGSGLDRIDEILTQHPDAVIEFSCWSVSWGDQPGERTIIWEVREY